MRPTAVQATLPSRAARRRSAPLTPASTSSALATDPLDLLGGGDGALGPQLRCLTLEPSEGLLEPHDGRLNGLGQSSVEDLHSVLLELGGVDHHPTALLHGIRELSRALGRRRELLLDPRHHRVRIQV